MSANGLMTVFGFGRAATGTNKYMTQAPAHFSIGLMGETAYEPATQVIDNVYRDLAVTVHSAQPRNPSSIGPVLTPTLTLTMAHDAVVTATFIQEQYSLTVNSSPGGAVTVEPAQPTYLYDERVTLTATPNAGWTFAGWAGDLSGTTNPAKVTMTGNTNITATFAQEEYLLSLTQVGNGTVSREPSQPTYRLGDVVTFTATAGSGWLFLTWSGDLSGTKNPQSVTVAGNKQVTAHFGATPAGFIVASANGQVTVNLVKDHYQVGDEVALTAAPNEGLEFVEWQIHGTLTAAALGTTENSLTITVDGQNRYEPTFRPQESAGSTIVFRPSSFTLSKSSSKNNLTIEFSCSSPPSCCQQNRRHCPYRLAIADRKCDCTISTLLLS